MPHSPPPAQEHRLHVIGQVRSALKSLDQAPCQGDEGAPRAAIELDERWRDGLAGLAPGDELYVFTWLHQASRDVLRLHPRGDTSRPLTGVFATRSPARPNPIGMHRVRLLAITAGHLDVEPLEALDGTPVIDIKPVLGADGTTR